MEESNKELPNVTISFKDDLAVLQASEKQLISTKSKAVHHVVRTLRSISNKTCFVAQISTGIL